MPAPRILPAATAKRRSDARRSRRNAPAPLTAPAADRPGGSYGGAPAPGGNVIPIGAARTIRWSRVRTARARIAVDYYERGEIRDRVVDALLTEILRTS